MALKYGPYISLFLHYKLPVLKSVKNLTVSAEQTWMLNFKVSKKELPSSYFLIINGI